MYIIYILYRRHRCPHCPRSNLMYRSTQPCVLSEYTTQFKRYQARPRPSLRPEQKAIPRDVPMECKTSNKQDFVAHPVTPLRIKPPAVYKPTNGEMDCSSEYKLQFLGKWAVPVAQIRPKEAKKTDTQPFTHKSTQSVDFVAFPVSPREIHGTKNSYVPPKEPFDGASTIQSDFVDFGRVELTQSLKPPQQAKISTDPFEGSTSYRTSFTPMHMPERFQQPRAVYVPSGKEFFSETTVKADFHTHPGAKPSKTMKPPQNAVRSDTPFDGITTSKQSYKSWELPARHSRPPTTYTPPTERFATQSTFRTDFPDYGRVLPPKSLRPPQKVQQVASFEGLTTQRLDYKAWKDVEQQTPIRREKKYEPPTKKFDATSTFKDHYRGSFVPQAQSAKPAEKPYSRSGKAEYNTSYGDSYAKTCYKPCPSAALLVDSHKLPQFVYSHQDAASGHKFFMPKENTGVA